MPIYNTIVRDTPMQSTPIHGTCRHSTVITDTSTLNINMLPGDTPAAGMLHDMPEHDVSIRGTCMHSKAMHSMSIHNISIHNMCVHDMCVRDTSMHNKGMCNTIMQTHLCICACVQILLGYAAPQCYRCRVHVA